MKVAMSGIAFLLALACYGYLVAGWAPVIAQQGLAAAITEQSTQPPLRTTLCCAGLATCLLLLGVFILLGRRRK
jgi:hypothetical protein